MREVLRRKYRDEDRFIVLSESEYVRICQRYEGIQSLLTSPDTQKLKERLRIAQLDRCDVVVEMRGTSVS